MCVHWRDSTADERRRLAGGVPGASAADPFVLHTFRCSALFCDYMTKPDNPGWQHAARTKSLARLAMLLRCLHEISMSLDARAGQRLKLRISTVLQAVTCSLCSLPGSQNIDRGLSGLFVCSGRKVSANQILLHRCSAT